MVSGELAAGTVLAMVAAACTVGDMEAWEAACEYAVHNSPPVFLGVLFPLVLFFCCAFFFVSLFLYFLKCISNFPLSFLPQEGFALVLT